MVLNYFRIFSFTEQSIKCGHGLLISPYLLLYNREVQLIVVKLLHLSTKVFASEIKINRSSVYRPVLISTGNSRRYT